MTSELRVLKLSVDRKLVFLSLWSCPVCSTWDGRQGPVKDVYSLANNPQYKLEVHCPAGGAAVWVLLTRHITDKVEKPIIRSFFNFTFHPLRCLSNHCCLFVQDDFAQNKEFITLVVYKTDGKKVYYPGMVSWIPLSNKQTRILKAHSAVTTVPCSLRSRPPALHRRHPHQQPPLPDQDEADQRRDAHLHAGGVPV